MIFHKKSEFSYLILMEILSIITLNPTHFIIKIYFLYIFFIFIYLSNLLLFHNNVTGF
jgi:hypothetical protein